VQDSSEERESLALGTHSVLENPAVRFYALVSYRVIRAR